MARNPARPNADAYTFRFKPRKKRSSDGMVGPYSNEERAARAEEMLKLHPDFLTNVIYDGGPEGFGAAVADAISDLLHFCDQHKVDVEKTLARAKLAWECER